MDIKIYLNNRRRLVDSFIEDYFNAPIEPPIKPNVLKNSITYSLSAGGKRIRPILCLSAYEACGGRAEDIVPYASALEFIHTYSLIHDDLPAMDNDDLRRGKPTNHKVFGEGMAILAGDALLTEAFYLIADCGLQIADLNGQSEIINHKSKILRVIREIAIAAGAHGMVGGQAQDLLSEDLEPDSETLSFIHSHKTAALIAASVRTGGILANCSEDELQRLTKYGENIGLAFQVIDDILDVEGETEVLGKTAGSDEKKKKMTYPKVYGIEKSRDKAKELISIAVESLTAFDERAEPLRAIARYLLERRS
jgi:geranylgeranyl diphosphate synthase type II